MPIVVAAMIFLSRRKNAFFFSSLLIEYTCVVLFEQGFKMDASVTDKMALFG